MLPDFIVPDSGANLHRDGPSRVFYRGTRRQARGWAC